MSLLDDWCDCAESMVRCLTAVTPDYGDRAFGRTLESVAAGPLTPGLVDPAGDWFQTTEGRKAGYIFIGPAGGDHHFQADVPDGVDLAAIRPMPLSPAGLLWREIGATLEQARSLAAGKPSSVHGADGPMAPQCEAADLPRVREVAALLEAAFQLRDAGVEAALLGQSMQAFLAGIGGGLPGAVQAAGADIMGLRSRYLASAPLWAVAMLRQEVLTRLLGPGPAPPYAYKLFGSFSALCEPWEAMRQGVADLAAAHQGEAIMAVCDAALEQAEAAVQSALDAGSIAAHQAELYHAAGHAFTAMRIAEVMRDNVAPGLRPKDLTGALLGGYVAQTEEIVVRAGQALAVTCVNAGSRAAFQRHRAQVAAEGPGKADELIEEYWFYPRTARGALLHAA